MEKGTGNPWLNKVNSHYLCSLLLTTYEITSFE